MASSCFEEHKPTLAMVAVQCIYVGMAMAGKAAVAEGFSPMVFVFYNQAIATLFMVPVTIFSRGGNVRQIVALGWKGFWLVFVTSLVGCTACMYFYYVGLDLSTPSVTTAMLNLIPGITFVMAASTGLESVKLRSLKTMAKVLGTIICMGGAICMGLFKGPRLSSTMEFSTISGSPDKQWMIGCLSLLAAASCRSIWFILQVPICKSYLDPLSLATWMCFLSAILSAILTLFFIPDPRKWKITSILELCSCLFTGIFASGVAYFLQSWSTSARGPVFCAMFSPLSTVITTIFSVLLLQEELHLGSFLGAIVVVVGLYIFLWGQTKDLDTKNIPNLDNDSGERTVSVDGGHEDSHIEIKEPLLASREKL